jgi:hypothetical protein
MRQLFCLGPSRTREPEAEWIVARTAQVQTQVN